MLNAALGRGTRHAALACTSSCLLGAPLQQLAFAFERLRALQFHLTNRLASAPAAGRYTGGSIGHLCKFDNLCANLT
jgi:hypothetical protein